MHFSTLTTALVVVLATFATLTTAHGGKPVDSKTPSCGAPFCARHVLANWVKAEKARVKGERRAWAVKEIGIAETEVEEDAE